MWICNKPIKDDYMKENIIMKKVHRSYIHNLNSLFRRSKV